MATDTKRLINHPLTGNFVGSAESVKIGKLTEFIGFASCGTSLDEAKTTLAVSVSAEDTKDKISKMAIDIYSKFLSKVTNEATNFYLFGHEDQKGFIRHFEWNTVLKKFIIEDFLPGTVVADGVEEIEFLKIGNKMLERSIVPAGGYQMNYWAQMVMDEAVHFTAESKNFYGDNPVGFPIDTLIYRVNRRPRYERYNEIVKNPKEKIEAHYASDDHTVRF